MNRGKRREVVGIVTSDRMQKSVVVMVERLVKHPVYGKYIRRRTKLMAHNEGDQAKLGDSVELVETRPLSKRKSWRVLRIVKKAPVQVETIDLTAIPEEAAAKKTKGEGQS
jgi:small subunit ribosomal protein S17